MLAPNSRFPRLITLLFLGVLIAALSVRSLPASASAAAPPGDDARTVGLPSLPPGTTSGLSPLAPSPWPSDTTPALRGSVSDANTGSPVVGAVVEASALGLKTATDGNGGFDLGTIGVPAGPNPLVVTVTISATGFGSYEFKNLSLFNGAGATILTAEMRDVAQTNDFTGLPTAYWGPRGVKPTGVSVPTPRVGLASASQAPSLQAESAVTGCSGFYSNIYPPTTILVYRRSLGRIDNVDFNYYVRNVLPDEWSSDWDRESLQSGAMAVKTFAWYWKNTSQQTYNGQCYDIDDTVQQVYVPGSENAKTNAAIADTWRSAMTEDGGIFQAYYQQGNTNEICGNYWGSPDPTGTHMSQYGTWDCAQEPPKPGLSWAGIIRKYYFSRPVTLVDQPLAAIGYQIGGGTQTWVFGQGSDANLYYRYWNGSVWSGWTSIGSPYGCQSGPALDQVGTYLDVWCRASTGTMWLRSYNGSSWGNWYDLGNNGSAWANGPGAIGYVTGGGTQTWVFAQGSDYNYYYRYRNGSAWSAWTNIGSPYGCESAPAASQYSSNLDVFCRGSNGEIWVKTWNGSSWSGWQSLGGSMAGGVAAHGFSSQTRMFATGVNATASGRYRSGSTWGSWENIGRPFDPKGDCLSGPGIDAVGSYEDVWCRGVDNVAWAKTYHSGWGNWWNLVGALP